MRMTRMMKMWMQVRVWSYACNWPTKCWCVCPHVGLCAVFLHPFQPPLPKSRLALPGELNRSVGACFVLPLVVCVQPHVCR